ncbi:hypothetical protein ACFSQT_14205 [Mesorhizobium calcicola]|uniref:Uncharacterized protein n=1 Tax=Mesorhizobium calcicola TaxID=1300310 RepID=A0ABW4WCQ8_9HYPH
MARRKPDPAVAAAAPVVAPAPAATAVKLTDYLTVKRADTHADLRIKEAVHAAMRRICDLTSKFIAEKEAEGFSLAEILELYEVVGPVAPTVTEEDGRVRVHWDIQIVERGDQ